MGKGKEDSGRCGAGTARRDTTRSVATGFPFREVLEQVRRNVDFGGGSESMLKSVIARRDDGWGEFTKRM